MKMFYKVLSVVLLSLTFLTASCSKDSGSSTASVRDYDEQYAKDIDSIDYFLDNYSMSVSPEFDVTFTKITSTTPGTPIRTQTDYPLQYKTVTVDDHGESGIDYKVYYINLREGANEQPRYVDSAFVSYRGVLLDNDAFDQAESPVWLPLYTTIKGWQDVIPMFKTGFYTTGEGPEPVLFTDYGAGVMFVPSGLGYYSQTRTGIPSYSPLVFSFKLYAMDAVDHDSDGILSRDEVENAGDDPMEYDSDGDGTANMLDVDDDGDGIKTKHEIHKDDAGNIIFEDCDNDGIPNYLDADSNGQTCN